MKLSDVYREELERAAMWETSRAGKTPQVDMRFSEESWDCAAIAENLAHCIAAFGDLDVDNIDVEALRRASERRFFPGRNPWVRGLSFLKKRAASQLDEESRSRLSSSRNDTEVSNERLPAAVNT